MSTQNEIKRRRRRHSDTAQERLGAAEIREYLGLRTQDVAVMVGRSASVLNRIENKIIGCSLDLAEALAAYYCCTIDEVKRCPDPDRLALIKDAFEYQRGQEAAARIAARQAEQEKGVA